jgi:hypothetical protein
MKNSCNAALLVLLLALLVYAQEVLPAQGALPPPPPSDSSLAITPDSSLAVAPAPLPISIEQEKTEIKAETKIEARIVEKREEKDYQKNLRTVVYLHPLPLFFGAAFDMFMFSSTFEIPLSLNNSVVIQPAIWLGSSNGYIPNLNIFNILQEDLDEMEYKKLKRAGSGIGIRHYILDRGSGFYLQAIASAYYISAESISLKEFSGEYYDYDREITITTWTKLKGVVGELMGYVGLAHKWQNINLSYEVGLGYGYDGTKDDKKTKQLGYINSLATNFNICLGIPF